MLGGFSAYPRFFDELFSRRCFDFSDRSESPEKFLPGLYPHARDRVQDGNKLFTLVKPSVIGDREPVRLIPEMLDQLQYRRILRQHQREFPARQEKSFVLLRDRKDR